MGTGWSIPEALMVFAILFFSCTICCAAASKAEHLWFIYHLLYFTWLCNLHQVVNRLQHWFEESDTWALGEGEILLCNTSRTCCILSLLFWQSLSCGWMKSDSTSSCTLTLDSSMNVPILWCLCGKSFLQHAALNNHTCICNHSKKQVANALSKAKKAFLEWQEYKRQQQEESSLHLLFKPASEALDVSTIWISCQNDWLQLFLL